MGDKPQWHEESQCLLNWHWKNQTCYSSDWLLILLICFYLNFVRSLICLIDEIHLSNLNPKAAATNK